MSENKPPTMLSKVSEKWIVFLQPNVSLNNVAKKAIFTMFLIP